MSGIIVTPLKDEDMERAVAREGDERSITTLNNAVISIRQAAEWGMGAVEKVFRRLLLRLPFNPNARGRRLMKIYQLYNVRVRRINVSQIRTFFCCWREKSVKNMTTCLRFMVH